MICELKNIVSFLARVLHEKDKVYEGAMKEGMRRIKCLSAIRLSQGLALLDEVLI